MVHNYSINECSIFIFDIDWYWVNACIQQSLLLLQTLLHLLFSNNSHNALLVYISCFATHGAGLQTWQPTVVHGLKIVSLIFV